MGEGMTDSLKAIRKLHPDFQVTPEQAKLFGGTADDVREKLVLAILKGERVGDVTMAQMRFVRDLKLEMGDA